MNEQRRYYLNKLAFEIDAWDLNAALKEEKNVVILDARSADAYKEEHIARAINLPHRTIAVETTRHIDKSALVVTYCDGVGCNSSTKSALMMEKLGFRVKELIGGLDWWKRSHYKTERG